MTPGGLDSKLESYVVSDYRSFTEQENEADVPVPDRLLPFNRLQELVGRLKRGQKLGILLWLESVGAITLGGRSRLLYLQEGSSVEALLSGLKFKDRLSKDKKLQQDFSHCMRILNTRPRSATYRRMEKRRIGIGYRDKGTLPSSSSRERRMAQDGAWIPISELPDYNRRAIESILPFALSEDGEFLDSQVFAQYLKPVWALPESWGLPSS